MKKVFVSGCYDIIHAGHIQFFKDAKALGDHLTVCFASAAVLELLKNRKPSIPDDNKREIIGALMYVDEVVSSSDIDPVFDFRSHIDTIRPNILAVTEDDANIKAKRTLCRAKGMKLVVLPKRNFATQISTSSTLASIKELHEQPLRVDFAGGWLDVPKFSIDGAYVVNCTITPKVSLRSWPYNRNAGLGGSAAYSILTARNSVVSELNMGVGWQDPAVILETGLCVWRSGQRPVLEIKINPDFLNNKIALLWTNKSHNTPSYVDAMRDYKRIELAGKIAFDGALKKDIKKLSEGVNASYEVQLLEGMKKLPTFGELAKKYSGGGHGGYALYIFDSEKNRKKFLKNPNTMSIEPYIKEY